MNTVLITGGSEGIGYALARNFAKDGYTVLLHGRDPVKLTCAVKQLKSEFSCEVKGFVCDLSQSDGAYELYKQLPIAEIDTVILNAGFGLTGKSWEIDPKRDDECMRCNVLACMDLAKLFLQEFVKRKNGLIMTVASTGAFQPGPYIASYYASKSFVLSYTRAVAREAKPYGVQVCCLVPGPVKTDFYAKSGQKTPWYAMDKDSCAVYAYRHRKNRTVIIPGWYNRVIRIVPSGVRMRFVEKIKAE